MTLLTSRGYLPAHQLFFASMIVACMLACGGCGGGGSGSGGSGGGSTTLTGSVTPAVTPAGTSGTNQSATIGGVPTSNSAVAGEAVKTQDATTTLPGGTTVEVRHGFFPSVDGIAPSGSG